MSQLTRKQANMESIIQGLTGGKTVITKDNIRSILSDSAVMNLPVEVTNEMELAIDSLTLLKLQLVLDEQHGIVIDPQFKDMHLFTSIDGIYDYLTQYFPDRVAPLDDNADD
jgi:acyl carrier protein